MFLHCLGIFSKKIDGIMQELHDIASFKKYRSSENLLKSVHTCLTYMYIYLDPLAQLCVSDATPLKVVEHRSEKTSLQVKISKSVRMYHLAYLLSKFSLQVKLSHKKASECTILFYCFQNVLHKSQYQIKNRQNVPFSFIAFKMSSASQNVVSKTVIMYHLVLLLSRCPLHVKLSNQNASECTIQFYCFQNVLFKSKYRIKKRQNAPFIVLVFKMVSVVSKYRFKQRQNATITVPIFTFPSEGWPTSRPTPLIKSKHVLFFSLQF